MMLRISAVSTALVIGCLSAVGPALAVSDEERKKICAKAEERYQELFGKPSAEADVAIVTMHKYNFCPHKLTVKKGTTVRWVNVDKRTSHSVWFKLAGKPESDRLFSLFSSMVVHFLGRESRDGVRHAGRRLSLFVRSAPRAGRHDGHDHRR